MRVVDRLRRSIQGSAAKAFDQAFVFAMEMRGARMRKQAESLSHDERLERLRAIEADYGAPDRLDYFQTPPSATPTLRSVRKGALGAVVMDASWSSGCEPFLAAVRDSYLSLDRNRTAHARLYLARQPRPAVILIHGYMGGQWAVEERAWPIAWLQRRGLDVAIAVLPFHALRGHPDRRAPPFPGADPRVTNEGFRQAVFDLRSLMQLLRARGAPQIGVMGMSLGGYTTSLLATLEPTLSFAVPIIPLASIADFARARGRLGTPAQATDQHRALEAANAVVSPFSRPSQLPPDRMLVIGGDADRITPIAHAERIARHFDAPLVRIHGGHLLQFGRGEAFREIGKMLRRLDLELVHADMWSSQPTSQRAQSRRRIQLHLAQR